MSNRSQRDTHLTVYSSLAGPAPLSTLTATPGSAPAGHLSYPPALLPSPPFSPQQRKAELAKHSRHSSLQYDGHSAHMLHAPSAQENAKLAVTRLLQNEPSPPPSTSGADATREGESSRAAHSRSNSVPLPTAHQIYSSSALHRNRVSASAAIPSASPCAEPSSLTEQPAYSTSSAASAPPVQRPTLPPIQAPPALGANPNFSAAPSQAQYTPTSAPYQPPHVQVRPPSPQHTPSKRPAPAGPAAGAPPAKRQSKWTPEEDALIIELRGSGMKWEEISKRLPGRSAISCRLHYQNYLERRSEWDEERKNRLARLYERLKPEMWGPLAAELGIPWRAAEAMHWQLGEADMARRAGVVPFSLAASSNSMPPAPSNMPPAPHPYPPTAPEMYGPRPSRASSLGRPLEDSAYPPRSGPMMSGPPPVPATLSMPPSTGAMLPSLAELERGHAAYDDRARMMDPHPPRYAPHLGPPYEHRR